MGFSVDGSGVRVWGPGLRIDEVLRQRWENWFEATWKGVFTYAWPEDDPGSHILDLPMWGVFLG